VCNIEVSGAELLALSQPPSAEHSTAKIGRLRLGDCARKGCDSLFYSISFAPVDGLDWPAVLESTADIQEHPGERRRRRATLISDVLQLARRHLVPRAAIALVFILAIVMLRQWYIGGRIFLIREPQKFYFAPGPEIPASTEE
jgi:hypothetical protein